MIEVQKTSLEGVLVIKLDRFEDHRGEYVELYNQKIYEQSGITAKFVQDDFSVSTRNVLRGIHGDKTTWKLITCPQGKLYFVVVNCDQQSAQFGKWQSFVLSDRNRTQVLVPPGYGNGHLVLSNTAIFQYKQSTYYDPKSQFSYKWNDQRLNIWWPVKDPTLSRRDEEGRYRD